MVSDARRVAVPAIMLAAAVAAMAVFWFLRPFQHDDFFFAYLSWIRTTGAVPVRDYFAPSFSPLADLFSPLFASMPDSLVPLDIARGVILVAALLLLYVVFAITRDVSGSVTWAIASAAATAWEPHFVLRIADIRSDPVSALALLSAALLLIRRQAFFVAGLLAGAAATLSFKLVVVVPLLIILAFPSRRAPMCLLGVPMAPLAYGLFRLGSDGFDGMMSIVRDTIANSGHQTVSRSVILIDAFKTAPLFWIAIAAGAIGAFRSATRTYAIFALAAFAVYIIANPFLYSYNFVVLVPLLAPLISGMAAWLPSIAASIVCVLLVAQGVPAMIAATRPSNVEQRRLVEWIWSATAKREHVFDWQGMHFGRPGIRHWWIFTALIPRYQSGGWYALRDEWRERGVTLMIDNYRFGAMTPADRAWLEAHYVFIARCALAPGHIFAPGETSYDAPVEGDYRIVPPDAKLSIDEQPAQSRVHLRAGMHRVVVAQKLALVYTSPLREAAGPPPCPRSSILFTF